MSQSSSFNKNELMVLFNWDWSRLIDKRYLIRSLNLFASDSRVSNDQSLLNSYIQVDDQILLKKIWYIRNLVVNVRKSVV